MKRRRSQHALKCQAERTKKFSRKRFYRIGSRCVLNITLGTPSVCLTNRAAPQGKYPLLEASTERYSSVFLRAQSTFTLPPPLLLLRAVIFGSN